MKVTLTLNQPRRAQVGDRLRKDGEWLRMVKHDEGSVETLHGDLSKGKNRAGVGVRLRAGDRRRTAEPATMMSAAHPGPLQVSGLAPAVLMVWKARRSATCCSV